MEFKNLKFYTLVSEKVDDELVKCFIKIDSFSEQYFAYYITKSGRFYSIGANNRGQLALGNNTYVSIQPYDIDLLSSKTILDIYDCHSCVIAKCDDGTLYGWGGNKHGQLALGHESDWQVYHEPTHISFFDDKSIKVISAGDYHIMALTENGDIYGWGLNDKHQVYHGKSKSAITTPIKITSLTSVRSIFCFASSTFAISPKKKIFIWGENNWLDYLPPIIIKQQQLKNLLGDQIICNDDIIAVIKDNKFHSYDDSIEPFQAVAMELDINDDVIVQTDNSITLLSNDTIIHYQAKSIEEYHCNKGSVINKLMNLNKIQGFRKVEKAIIPPTNQDQSQEKSDDKIKSVSSQRIKQAQMDLIPSLDQV